MARLDGLEMNKATVGNVFRAGLLAVVALALAGCELRPHILSTAARRVGETELVEVEISARDAARIKRRQMYFYILVVNCEGDRQLFAMDPYVGKERAVEFRFSTGESTTKLTGSMPARIFEKYSKPCAALEGGGYFTGTLRTDLAPIPHRG